jgi:multifunctional 2-oxoglutarate metabolism enzyme
LKNLEEIFGPNSALVEELYSQFQENPDSVPAHWRTYFEGELVLEDQDETHEIPAPTPAVAKPEHTPKPQPIPPPPPVAKAPGKTTPATQAVPAAEEDERVKKNLLKGAASKIAANMEISLEIPTATSLRVIPVKMLWEDRMLLNRYLEQRTDRKVTFTHLIAWAVIQALKEYPSLNYYYEEVEGKTYSVNPGAINFGVAIDLPGRNGTRSLMVPNVKSADSMSFPEFMDTFDDLIRRARAGKLEISDFERTTISLTNPGTIGTVSSMPRLMKGQGAIIATGAMNYPAEFQAMSQDLLNHLGISKVMTMTCTYDHRIIQGAESGSFLSRVHSLLNGEADFYDRIFEELEVPFSPIAYGTDNYTGFLSGAQSGLEANKKAIAVIQLIQAYRSRGHSIADLNPLRESPKRNEELDLETFGLSMWDLDREFYCGGLGGKEKATLREITQLLRDTYCRKIGSEFLYIQITPEREWLRERMESVTNTPDFSKADKIGILRKLNHASAFEEFLHKKFVGHKRFSLEGAESLIPMLDVMLERSADYGVNNVLLGMAHRGRLNVLVNTLGKSYSRIFAEFEGNIDPDTFHGSGDVKYHLGTTGRHETANGKVVRLELLPNPSHLESVNPVVEGAARAMQDKLSENERQTVLPLLIHGDAAFAGQGVVAETLNMSQLDGYKTGGTIHVIINNQIGFTTLPKDGRSTKYASDLAKTILAPVFHVNGDDPESCAYAMRLALEYRQKFGKDVVIDLICYRKHGHNEGDEPAFTQPSLYKEINNHSSVREIYSRELVRKNELEPTEVENIFAEFDAILEQAFEEAKTVPTFEVREEHIERKDTRQEDRIAQVDTSLDPEMLQKVATRLNTVSTNFDANPKLLRILAKRNEVVARNERKIEWGFAEALAFGTLLVEGKDIRLSGQDVERGTFSHRHSVLHGTESLERFVPLNHITDNQGRYMVYNSLLSEFAVLGFEFGYSSEFPDALVIWEAQFGDFSNGAQIIIDQYISSSEAKWGQNSSVVMLLPHGYEGQGPEHSSCRLERYLQLCAEDNLQVVNCTTPAQYYHMLRRQALQEKRKPLIVATPKSLLRHPQALSTSEELASGKFNPVIDDSNISSPDDVNRIVFCSGKVYYDLLKHQQDEGVTDVAVVRLEQFYPFPNSDVKNILSRYENATDIVWCQEEPKNMGGWSFVWPRLMEQTFDDQAVRYIGRVASAAPATGSAKLHAAEQERLVQRAITGKVV